MPGRDEERLLDTTDERLTRALEQAPPVALPAGFAARVAAEALSRFGETPVRSPATHFGTYAVWLSTAALLLAMLLLAGFTRSSPAVGFALEATMCAEFVVLTLYLALRPSLFR